MLEQELEIRELTQINQELTLKAENHDTRIFDLDESKGDMVEKMTELDDK